MYACARACVFICFFLFLTHLSTCMCVCVCMFMHFVYACVLYVCACRVQKRGKLVKGGKRKRGVKVLLFPPWQAVFI